MSTKSAMAFWGATVLLASAALAQAPGGPHRTYGSATGFGNILFPGTGSAPNMGLPAISIVPPMTGYRIGGTTHAERLGATVAGRPIAPAQRGRGGVTYAVPYAVPVYVGGYGYGYSAPPAEVNVNLMPPVQQQPVSPVVINQYYTAPDPRPVLRQYPEGSLPESSSSLKSYEAPPAQKFPDPADSRPGKTEATARPSKGDEKPTITLIAFKSGSIYPALGYWVEGDTLHYVARDKSINKASLDLIDRDLSSQLNRERGVDFSLAPLQ